jgi:hypothetical protein
MIASNKRLLLENNPREYYKYYYYYYYYSYERAPRKRGDIAFQFFFHDETLNPLSSNPPPFLSVLFPSLLFERERRERQDFGLRRATSKRARSFEEGEPPPRVRRASLFFRVGVLFGTREEEEEEDIGLDF